MIRISAGLVCLALAAQCQAKEWRDVVSVQPHPSYNYAYAFTQCSVDQFGNVYVLTCEEMHTDPLVDLQNPNRTVKILDIGVAPISQHQRYIGECKESGDDGVTMVFKCDDTIFKNGFQKHHN